MDTEKPTTKSEEDMNKTQAIKVIMKLGRQHGKADYILGEVYAHLMTKQTAEEERLFRLWFLRQWAKYQKGDV